MPELIDFILHIDTHLQNFVVDHGALVYLLLFCIVFCETGLVVTPFLPGDSLLFAVGTLAGSGWLRLEIAFPLLLAAAIVGDFVNYSAGSWLGPKVFEGRARRFFRREYLDKTQAFYLKYGGRAIILARFIPIVRTFAPFVAGIGKMPYREFLAYNVLGGILWVGLFCLGGYIFGGLPLVRDNMKLVILGIIGLSIIPVVWEYVKARRQRKQTPAAPELQGADTLR